MLGLCTDTCMHNLQTLINLLLIHILLLHDITGGYVYKTNAKPFPGRTTVECMKAAVSQKQLGISYKTNMHGR